jgi:peptidyl-prolyl cis-trans isomerase SurA
MHEEKALINQYEIMMTDPKKAEKVYKYALKNSPEKTLKKHNRKGEIVKINGAELSQEEKGKMQGLPWIAGSSTPMTFNENKSAHTFTKVEQIMPPRPKSLNEARGYIIADYQDYLEKQWIEELRAGYDVQINQDVLNKLIR